jgi:UDP-glucose 4-epimerase
MSKVLITGVAGFLGSHLADKMLALGHEVIGVDNLIGGYWTNVPADVEFYEMHCQQLPITKSVMRGVDLVYNCAALAYEGLSVFSPHTVVESIVGVSTAVFSAAISAGVKRIVHCSSMARYGAIVTPYKEGQVCHPQDPYGIAKLCAENILRNLCEVHNIEFVIAVPHNIIGPRQKYDDPYRNVASIMMNRMLRGCQPVIYGDGHQMRCFSFVDDCLDCLVKMSEQANVVGEVINIGPDEETITINELAVKIAKHTLFKDLAPIYMPGRPQEVRTALCSSEKARRLLGYRTKTSLDDGLKSMVEHIVARGTKPFKYHLPIEIVKPYTPKTWTERLF